MNWMTKKEAAEYLKVSARQLERLRFPRTHLGRSPRYSQEVIDEYMRSGQREPYKHRRKKGGLMGPPPSQSIPLDPEEHLRQMGERLTQHAEKLRKRMRR